MDDGGLRVSHRAMEVTLSAQLQEPCFAFALNLEALVLLDLLDDRFGFGYIWMIWIYLKDLKGFLKRL